MIPRFRKFDLIAADPPWKYEFSRSNNRAIKYPTMTLSEMALIPVRDFAAEDAVLLLWVPPPKLQSGMNLLGFWGFEYVTGAVWDKKKIGPGYYFRNRHEHLLIGKRGTPALPDPSIRMASVLEEPRREHSRKPEAFYNAMDKMYPAPKVRRVELFACKKRPGWTGWGLVLGWELGSWGVRKVEPRPDPAEASA